MPPHWSKDCGIARSCKLFLGTDLERGAPVLEAPVVWPLWNAAENPQRQVCKQSLNLERGHNARCAVLGAAHATSGIYGQCIDLTFAPQHSRARSKT